MNRYSRRSRLVRLGQQHSVAPDCGCAFLKLTVRAGVSEMLAFYESVFPTDCVSESGDMWIFQWGTYIWGERTQVEINITRQFMESATQDGDAISQLRLTFEYLPNKETAMLGDGNRWCESRLATPEFREFIYSSQVCPANADLVPPGVSLHHEYV